MPVSTLMTAEQFFELSGEHFRAELIEGELREMSPSSLDHILIAGRVIAQLGPFVLKQGLGEVGSSEGGFIVQRTPDTVLAPDVVSVSYERLAAIRRPGAYATGAPDLIVEIKSPSDRTRDLEQKATAWLSAGAKLVWVINPRKRTATIYRPDAAPETIDDLGELTGDDVVPRFRVRLSDVLV